MVVSSGGSGPQSPIEEEFRTGHLFWMPPGSTWLNSGKPQPFTLAMPCRRGTLGTLVYGSTQETEDRFGAARISVAPARAGLGRNGLGARTFFYPGILLPVSHRRLPQPAGFLGKSVDELRAALRVALGIGCGSCRSTDAPADSRRGRIVQLSNRLAAEIGTSFAVLLTEPRYSAEMRYHVILPVFGKSRRLAGTHDVVFSAREWLGVFPDPVEHALLPIPTTHSVWYPVDVLRQTEYVLDDDSLAEIDRALCGYFSLPEG